jgi:hypothetical protein
MLRRNRKTIVYLEGVLILTNDACLAISRKEQGNDVIDKNLAYVLASGLLAAGAGFVSLIRLPKAAPAAPPTASRHSEPRPGLSFGSRDGLRRILPLVFYADAMVVASVAGIVVALSGVTLRAAVFRAEAFVVETIVFAEAFFAAFFAAGDFLAAVFLVPVFLLAARTLGAAWTLVAF